MFKKTTVRMTAMYLVVLMAVSLLFSISLYKVLGTEIDRNYKRSVDFADRFGGFRPDPMQRVVFLNDRLEERSMSKDRLVGQLLFVNITILAAGGVLSYVLARRTLRPIEEAHDSLERFTSDAAHELRTPLTTMRTEIEVALMGERLNEKEARALLESNLEEVDRLTHLSERLLLLARLEDSSLPKEKVSVTAFVNKAVEVTRASADEKSIKVLAKLPKQGNMVVLGDESSLTELVVILLDNAIKYSPASTRITVKTVVHGKYIVVSITDQGVGIAEDVVPHIFDRFYRADSSRTGGVGHGYGLGLALAQKIAHLHGSLITVVSKKDEGSTFSFVLATV